MNDKVRSNNNDRDKILATVASTVFDFIKYHPRAMIFARGSTPSRTRLYQISILKNWSVIITFFEIRGFSNGMWEIFKRNKNYEEFAIKAR